MGGTFCIYWRNVPNHWISHPLTTIVERKWNYEARERTHNLTDFCHVKDLWWDFLLLLEMLSNQLGYVIAYRDAPPHFFDFLKHDLGQRDRHHFCRGACDFCSIDAVLRFNASPQATQYAAPGEAGVPHRSHFSYSTSTFFTSFLSLFWILLCTTNPKSARLHTNMAKHLLGSR